MYIIKVVNELVYSPHDVIVPRTTTLRSRSMLLYHLPFAHTNAFLHSFVYLKLVLLGTTYHADYITHANIVCIEVIS